MLLECGVGERSSIVLPEDLEVKPVRCEVRCCQNEDYNYGMHLNIETHILNIQAHRFIMME